MSSGIETDVFPIWLIASAHSTPCLLYLNSEQGFGLPHPDVHGAWLRGRVIT